jgi:DNA primase
VRFDQAVTREVRARTDIGTFIGAYVALRKRGNDLVGLCPFHGEKTPSFHVHPDRGFFKCFGCGAGGDVIAFYQKLENITFPEAVRELAKRAGIEVEAENPASARARTEKEAIFAANDLAAAFFHRSLILSPEAEAARAYCAERGLSKATIESFRLGYAPDRWSALVDELTANGIDLRLAERAGLVKQGQRGYYDFYRGRLMIPTYATTGEVVAFGGRALDGSEPKYLNTSTTPVYTKGRSLFALERARRAAAQREALIVVEGYLDCIALHQAGFTNAVASLGTAFTAEQAAELRKHAERIYVCFDADAAGSAATGKSIELLVAAQCSPRIVELPAGEDPDSFVRSHGPAAFVARLDAAAPWMEFQLERRIAQIRTRFVGASAIAREAETLVQSLPREEWDKWRVHVANRLGLAVDDLRATRFLANRANFQPRDPAGTFTRHAPAAEPMRLDRDVLTTILDEPALLAEYAQRIPPSAFKDERLRSLYERLIANAEILRTSSDVFAPFGDDVAAIEALAGLQKADRSREVRFADSASRRAHLDRIVERLAESEDLRLKAELQSRIDRRLTSGEPVPDEEKDEYRRLVERVELAARKRLGTRPPPGAVTERR